MLEKPANFGLPASDLFFLNEQDVHFLKDRILANNGETTVLIHPFFPMADMGSNKTAEEVENHKEHVLEFLRTTNSVLFVFEEFDSLDDTRFLLSINNPNNLPIYLIPTLTANPTPYNPVLDSIIEKWEYLYKTFKQLGVSKISLGGRMLDDTYFKHYGTLSGCVDYAHRMFAKEGFEVNLNNLCFPFNPLITEEKFQADRF